MGLIGVQAAWMTSVGPGEGTVPSFRDNSSGPMRRVDSSLEPRDRAMESGWVMLLKDYFNIDEKRNA